MGQEQKKEKTKSNRTQQKIKRGNNKVESNDRPEIPDLGETLDIPGLPSGPLAGQYGKQGVNLLESSHTCQHQLYQSQEMTVSVNQGECIQATQYSGGLTVNVNRVNVSRLHSTQVD